MNYLVSWKLERMGTQVCVTAQKRSLGKGTHPISIHSEDWIKPMPDIRCVCVCLVCSWQCSVPVGPVVRLVHPITSPFAFLPSHLRAELGRARFFPSSRTWYPGRDDFIR